MNCHRTREIDLLQFLEAPRRADFENFRQHYPECPDCSAELRAWTELHQTLLRGAGADHPDPELLERFDRAPAELAPGDRGPLERHLAGCAACREELRALRAAAPMPVSDPALRPRWREAWQALTRVVWHPAFAYALVAVLAFPLLYRSVGPLSQDAARRPDAGLASKASRASEGRSAARAPGSPAADPAAASAPPQPEALRDAPRREMAKRTPETAQELEAAPAAARPTEAPALEPAAEEQSRETPRTDEASEGPLYRGVRTRELQNAMADLHERDIYVPTLRLHRGAISRAPEGELLSGVLLEVPLPRDQPGGWARVSVAEESRDGKQVGLAEPSAGRAAAPERDAEVSRADPRSIEEARAVEPMQRAVIVHVPPEWLRAGRYRIDLELRDPERAAVIGRGRYRLQVEAP